MSHECEKCGREFDTQRGLSIHQSQKHSSEEKTEDTEDQEKHAEVSEEGQAVALSTKQFGASMFTFGLLTGIILGIAFTGVSLEGLTPELNQGSQVVELSSTEYPYGELEAGTGDGERTFNDTTFNLTGEPYIGSPDASVTAISFEDFQCPYCKNYNDNAYPQIVENHVRTGDVQYFYKNLPLTRIHPWAEPSAIASECALNQDAEAFWTFKNGFFDNQEELGKAYNVGNFDKSMYRWAEQTGLKVESFKQCYDNKEELSEVQQDAREASDIGVQATPTIFINNQKVEGAQPYSRFDSFIQSSLQ